MRTWLICLQQNARLTAGAVKTLKVAHAARSMAAMLATRIKPTTEPARVSITSRFDIWFFCCYAGQHWPLWFAAAFSFQLLVLASFFT